MLIANEHEALALEASLALPTSANERAAIAGLARRYALTGIVTLGSKGVLAVEADGRETAVAALPIVPVDTTGAGDTFVGILAVGLAGRCRFRRRSSARRSARPSPASASAPGGDAGCRGDRRAHRLPSCLRLGTKSSPARDEVVSG